MSRPKPEQPIAAELADADRASLNTLRGLRFTRPVTNEDMVAALEYVKSLSWSRPPVVDVCCHDGRNIALAVDIGSVRTLINYRAE